MFIGVCGPTLRVTTKSALYWVCGSASGSVVSSAGAANAGRRETKVSKPADISLFMIRSYYDPASSARSKKKEFEEFKELQEFMNRSRESGARRRAARNTPSPFLKRFF